MATEIVHWCDYHLSSEGEQRVLATQVHTFTLDKATFQVELCDECWVKHVEPYVTLVTLIGAKVKPGDVPVTRAGKPTTAAERNANATAGDGSLTCPRCAKSCQTRTGLGAHIWHLHGVRGLDRGFDLSIADGTDKRDE